MTVRWVLPLDAPGQPRTPHSVVELAFDLPCHGYPISFIQGEQPVTQDTPSPGDPAAEMIIRTVSLGGSLSLTAVHGPAGWAHFTVVADESTMVDAMDEDPLEAENGYVRAAGPAETWQRALGLMDCFVWPILHPDYVHPEFRGMVIAAVRERAADKDSPLVEFADEWLPEWERACSPGEEVWREQRDDQCRLRRQHGCDFAQRQHPGDGYRRVGQPRDGQPGNRQRRASGAGGSVRHPIANRCSVDIGYRHVCGHQHGHRHDAVDGHGDVGKLAADHVGQQRRR